MITLSHLSKTYPGNASPTLEDMTAFFPDRGCVYLIGKSGSGKSTLLHLIGGMDKDYHGSLKINGTELKSLGQKEREDYRFETIAFVFQSYKADDNETVNDNLEKALAITDLSRKEKAIRIDKALQEVSLKDKKSEKFKNLSGGEKKRISLARALIKDTPILLADEPLSSLNQKLRKQITDVLEKESQRRLVLIITHEKDEIPQSAAIYEIKNGHLSCRRKGKSYSKNMPLSYHRKSFGGLSFLRQLGLTLLRKREFLLLTLFSLMVGLFAVSFSFQLSTSVSTAMSESMTSYMDENSLVISNKDEGYQGTGFETADYQELERLRRNYPTYVLGVSSFYLSSFDSIFNNNQSLQAHLNSRVLSLPRLSLDSFLEYRLEKEISGKIIYGDTELDEEEVILALDEDALYGMYLLVYGYLPHELSESILERLGTQISQNPVSLRIQAIKEDWHYTQDYSMKIKGVVLDSSCYIIHSSETFANHFVTEVMHFKEVLEEDTIPDDQPWTLKKCEGFRLHPSFIPEFLKAFLYDESSKPYTLKPLKTKNYYDEKVLATHNHVALIKDYLPKIHIPEIQGFIHDHESEIQAVSYSSPIYTYTASGYISGFNKPFFFSKFKEKLNMIQDNSYYSSEDLGSFQGSSIAEIEGVIKGDLISAMDTKNGLTYITLDHSNLKPYYGKAPSSYQEIGISTQMAEELFGSCTAALGKTIYTLILDETHKEKDQYVNHFTEGNLLISGIYDLARPAVYQDSLFPLAYCFAYCSLPPEDIRVQEVLLKVDLTHYSAEDYKNQIYAYGDYAGSFPMLSMIQEIKKTLNQLSALFLGFSLLSLISAASLLSLSLFLIITEDKKEIGILLSLGYRHKEVSFFYLCLSLTIGFIGFILSLILSVFSEIVLKDTLMDLMNTYVMNVWPFLLSFGLSLILTLSIGLCFRRRIHKVSPMEAFERSFK